MKTLQAYDNINDADALVMELYLSCNRVFVICLLVGIGELKLFLQEGLRKTPIWWKSDNHGNKWHRAEVAVGRTHQVFTVIFEATRTFSELGDITVDDIAFLSFCPPGTNKLVFEMTDS